MKDLLKMIKYLPQKIGKKTLVCYTCGSTPLSKSEIKLIRDSKICLRVIQLLVENLINIKCRDDTKAQENNSGKGVNNQFCFSCKSQTITEHQKCIIKYLQSNKHQILQMGYAIGMKDEHVDKSCTSLSSLENRYHHLVDILNSHGLNLSFLISRRCYLPRILGNLGLFRPFNYIFTKMPSYNKVLVIGRSFRSITKVFLANQKIIYYAPNSAEELKTYSFPAEKIDCIVLDWDEIKIIDWFDIDVLKIAMEKYPTADVLPENIFLTFTSDLRRPPEVFGPNSHLYSGLTFFRYKQFEHTFKLLDVVRGKDFHWHFPCSIETEVDVSNLILEFSAFPKIEFMRGRTEKILFDFGYIIDKRLASSNHKHLAIKVESSKVRILFSVEAEKIKGLDFEMTYSRIKLADWQS